MKTKLIRITLKQLLSSDAHLGHTTNKRNPQNTSYIIAKRDNRDLIHLQLTLQAFEPVLHMIINTVANYEKLLVIAQHPAAKTYQQTHPPYALPLLTDKWVHGGLSNFKTIKNAKKHNFFKTLSRLPNGIFIIHANNFDIILNETKYLEIPTIGIADTNNNASRLQYSIPANNTSDSVIPFYLNLIKQACYYGYAKNLLKFKTRSSKHSTTKSDYYKKYSKNKVLTRKGNTPL